MSFSDKEARNWGCLTAGLFLFLFALPVLGGLALSDCASLDLNTCGAKQRDMLIWTIVLATACFVIMFGTNWLVRKLRKRSPD